MTAISCVVGLSLSLLDCCLWAFVLKTTKLLLKEKESVWYVVFDACRLANFGVFRSGKE